MQYSPPGLGYGLILSKTPAGPLLDALQYFDVHLGPEVCYLPIYLQIKNNLQAIFTTIARSTLSLVWELAARAVTTAFLFGVFESVRTVS